MACERDARRVFRLLATLVCVPAALAGCPGGEGSPPPPAPPAAPTLFYSWIGDGTVGLQWQPVEGAQSYNVYYASQGGITRANWQSQPGGAKVPVLGTAHTATGLANGITWHFVVTAVGPGGESSESPEVDCTPLAPPAAPGNVVAAAHVHGVALSWDAVPTANSYEVYLATVSGVTAANWASLPGGDLRVSGTTSCDVGPLTPGTPYYFVVVAMNAAGRGATNTTAR